MSRLRPCFQPRWWTRENCKHSIWNTDTHLQTNPGLCCVVRSRFIPDLIKNSGCASVAQSNLWVLDRVIMEIRRTSVHTVEKRRGCNVKHVRKYSNRYDWRFKETPHIEHERTYIKALNENTFKHITNVSLAQSEWLDSFRTSSGHRRHKIALRLRCLKTHWMFNSTCKKT